MFKKLKMKLSAKRVRRENEYTAAKRIHQSETKFERAVLFPFRLIARALRWTFDTTCAICSWIWDGIVWLAQKIWKWLCSINLIGLINLTLLVAIIVLFSMLIINIVNCRREPVVVHMNEKPVTIQTKLTKETRNLPTKQDNRTTINTIDTIPSDDPALRPHGDGKIYGDIIIESREEAIILQNGAHIHGNLYLQHMYKYVLPCDIKIEGNLFLRDLNMLHFCGRFDISGNIYVTPNSSFGPIPKNAYLGGQIIL